MVVVVGHLQVQVQVQAQVVHLFLLCLHIYASCLTLYNVSYTHYVLRLHPLCITWGGKGFSKLILHFLLSPPRVPKNFVSPREDGSDFVILPLLEFENC